MEVVTIVGLGATTLGLVITTAAFLRQRQNAKNEVQQRKRMERRLNRKDELEDLSEKLRGLHSRIRLLCERTTNPRSNEDIDLFLHDFVRDLLAYHYTTGNDPTVAVPEVNHLREGGEDNISLTTTSEVVDAYHQTDPPHLVQAKIRIQDRDDALRWSTKENIDWGIRNITFVRNEMNEIEDGNVDLLDQFDPSLLDDLDEAVDQFTVACYEQIFSHADGVEFSVDEYDNHVEIEDAIYETFVLSEDVYNAVENLETLAGRVDNIQTDVITTSFS